MNIRRAQGKWRSRGFLSALSAELAPQKVLGLALGLRLFCCSFNAKIPSWRKVAVFWGISGDSS